METQMRDYRRKLTDLNELDSPQAKGAFEQMSVKLKAKKAEYKDFCKQTGLAAQNERMRVYNYNKSLSQKVVWANKKEVEKYRKYHYNKNGTIVVTDDWKAKGKVSITKKYKPNAVIETTTRYKNGTEQIDRSLYDEEGWLKTQVHSGSHNNPSQHKRGINGEHGHSYSWDEDGTRKTRDERELYDSEREEHKDIL